MEKWEKAHRPIVAVETRDVHSPEGQTRILFIDDEQVLCALVQETLKQLGYEVVTHTSAGKALEVFCQSPYTFDLILSDLNMPEMNGEELVREIHVYRSDIPIIFCTGSYQPFPDQPNKALGVDGYLLKPFGLTELAETIRSVLSRNSNEPLAAQEPSVVAPLKDFSQPRISLHRSYTDPPIVLQKKPVSPDAARQSSSRLKYKYDLGKRTHNFIEK